MYVESKITANTNTHTPTAQTAQNAFIFQNKISFERKTARKYNLTTTLSVYKNFPLVGKFLNVR